MVSNLGLSPYDTKEGHSLQAKLKEAILQSQAKVEEQLQRKSPTADDAALEAENADWQSVIQHISGTAAGTPDEVTESSLSRTRTNLLHTVHPSADTLAAYFNMLIRLHPDRSGAESADLYHEYLNILLNAYSKAQQFTTSWWQMKSILEQYYNAMRQ